MERREAYQNISQKKKKKEKKRKLLPHVDVDGRMILKWI
jgi:hypothetical protein